MPPSTASTSVSDTGIKPSAPTKKTTQNRVKTLAPTSNTTSTVPSKSSVTVASITSNATQVKPQSKSKAAQPSTVAPKNSIFTPDDEKKRKMDANAVFDLLVPKKLKKN